MAAEVFADVLEDITESEEGMEAEAEAGEAGEESGELAEEVQEASERVSGLRKSVDFLKSLGLPQAVRSFAVFVAKNAAIAAVFYGTTVLLKKMFEQSSGGDRQKIGQKQKKVKAIAQLIKGINDVLNKLASWTKKNEDLTVDVGEGITVPFPDLLSKYTKPMGKDVQQAYEVSKQLKKKDGSGKISFVVPTTDQVTQLIKSSEAILDVLQKVISFADEKKEKYPALGTLPFGKDDVDKINDELQTIKKLPYA